MSWIESDWLKGQIKRHIVHLSVWVVGHGYRLDEEDLKKLEAIVKKGREHGQETDD